MCHSVSRSFLLVDHSILFTVLQGLLRVQGRPAVAYDDQGMVFAIAFGGYVRMFDARKFEKVSDLFHCLSSDI